MKQLGFYAALTRIERRLTVLTPDHPQYAGWELAKRLVLLALLRARGDVEAPIAA